MRKKHSLTVRADLLQELRDAAAYLQPITGDGLAEILDAAIAAELTRLRKKHTKGKRFPVRKTHPRGGWRKRDE